MPAPEGARKLIQNDNERQASFVRGRPVIQMAAGGIPCQVCKARGDGLIGAAMHPPGPVGPMRLRLHIGQALFWKPEVQHVPSRGLGVDGVIQESPPAG